MIPIIQYESVLRKARIHTRFNLIRSWRFLVCIIGLFLMSGCGNDDEFIPPPEIKIAPETTHQSFIIQDAAFLREISGIAPSRITDSVVWVHNDGGNKARIFALSTTGKYLGEVYFKGSENRDWEDMASVTDPVTNKNYVYVSSTGDNKSEYTSYFIHRIEEPNPDQYVNGSLSVASETIEFAYEDIDSQNVDAMAIDPKTMAIYLFSKGLNTSRVYSIENPFQNSQNMATAIRITSLGHGLVVSADVNNDQLLVKTFSEIYCYDLKPTLDETLATDPLELTYTMEPRGEAVCWQFNDEGYFSIGELAAEAPDPVLHYYKFIK